MIHVQLHCSYSPISTLYVCIFHSFSFLQMLSPAVPSQIRYINVTSYAVSKGPRLSYRSKGQQVNNTLRGTRESRTLKPGVPLLTHWLEQHSEFRLQKVFGPWQLHCATVLVAKKSTTNVKALKKGKCIVRVVVGWCARGRLFVWRFGGAWGLI